MICAGEPGRSACNGDSGGPLVANGVQIGSVAWGPDDCPGLGVFARLSFPEIRNWIHQISGV